MLGPSQRQKLSSLFDFISPPSPPPSRTQNLISTSPSPSSDLFFPPHPPITPTIPVYKVKTPNLRFSPRLPEMPATVRTLIALFTHQKNRKKKVFDDGFVKVNTLTGVATLHKDLLKQPIDTADLSKCEVREIKSESNATSLSLSSLRVFYARLSLPLRATVSASVSLSFATRYEFLTRLAFARRSAAARRAAVPLRGFDRVPQAPR